MPKYGDWLALKMDHVDCRPSHSKHNLMETLNGLFNLSVLHAILCPLICWMQSKYHWKAYHYTSQKIKKWFIFISINNNSTAKSNMQQMIIPGFEVSLCLACWCTATATIVLYWWQQQFNNKLSNYITYLIIFSLWNETTYLFAHFYYTLN